MENLSKLKWRCRRGVKELDRVLGHYLEMHYEQAVEGEKKAFAKLLKHEDSQLLAMLIGRLEAKDSCQYEVIKKLRG